MSNIVICIIILISILFIFFGIKGLNHYIIKNNKIPEWLYYPPFNCEKCSNFWYNTGVFGALSFLISPLYLIGNIMAIMDAIATILDEKKRTIKVDE